jgi:chromate transporter
VAAASFVAIYAFHVAFPAIIGAAALIGLLSPRRHFPGPKSHGDAHGINGIELPPVTPATSTRTLTVCGVCVALWWLPVFAIANQFGWESTHAQQGLFFSKAALVTFGGAYAVLPYVAQQAVDVYSWLTHPQMMSGLALAETTPGPLIMVLQFVGFVGGWNRPGMLSPMASATLGAAITSWVTFLPCFLFVFLGAPHVEKLGEQRSVSAALTSITAAVVGVILNLGIHFSQDALWPEHGPLDTHVAFTAVAAFVAMRGFKVGLMPVIGASALLGLAKHILWS